MYDEAVKLIEILSVLFNNMMPEEKLRFLGELNLHFDVVPDDGELEKLQVEVVNALATRLDAINRSAPREAWDHRL